MSETKKHEGLVIARLLMVFSSISPLFILWAIKGNSISGLNEWWFLGGCAFMVIVPNLIFWLRLKISVKNNDKPTKVVGFVEDHRDHLLVYLFAMLLPFYSATMITYRDLATHLVAIGFIVFLFWHLNMHYMNIFWAVKNYRVFTITPKDDGNRNSNMRPFVLITHRNFVKSGENISAYRISKTVFWEKAE